ncbi:MAG: glycine cleavage system protein GcvH [Candidatus Rokubacteria bacterium]|nr:glycine cleavage system protein GcvH [Candidatus Rokubacteria bacterium]
MATLFNCNLPEELFYLIDKHVWLRVSVDGPVTVGIDDVAQNLAGTIVACTPKKAGRAVPRGQSLATIESSKWVGPVPNPVTGEIVEVNEAVRKSPGILNQDPYGQGWLVRVRPTNWEAERAELATGAEGLEAYRSFLEAQGIQCRPAGG